MREEWLPRAVVSLVLVVTHSPALVNYSSIQGNGKALAVRGARPPSQGYLPWEICFCVLLSLR